MYTPDSVVYLCNVPLEADQKNQLHFSSVSEQTNYFESTVVKELTGFTFVRRDSAIRCPENIEDLYNCNYVMYQNSHFTDKWFYAFITELEYLNDAVTAIHIKTDVFQTWMFEAEILPSFVEREHTNNDTIGANILPEPPSIGPYKYVESHEILNGPNTDMTIIVAASDEPGNENTADNQGANYSRVYQGCGFWAFDYNDFSGVNSFLSQMTESNKIDSVVAIFMIPKVFVGDYTSRDKLSSRSGTRFQTQIALTNYTLDGYVPKNNKLYTYPYRFLKLSNNNGVSRTFHYEFFTENPIRFEIDCDISPSPAMLCYPINYNQAYNGSTLNADTTYVEGVSFDNLPTCSWRVDSYRQWIAANRNKLNASLFGIGFDAIRGLTRTAVNTANSGSVATGAANLALGLGNTALNAVESAISLNAQYSDAESKGNDLKGNVSGALLAQNLDVNFKLFEMCITSEYAKVIDDFFSMYGYTTNEVKVPNIGTRENWNYVKTIDIQITGAIPNDDMTELREIYNSGVTIWNNPETFGDYSQNNSIVS